MGPTPKKQEDQIPEWQKRSTLVQDSAPTSDTSIPDWQKRSTLVEDHTSNDKPQEMQPDATLLDHSLSVPVSLRVQVSALHTPEDRLRTVRKLYPDAQPHGDDNFIMTDPQTGKTLTYKQEGWRIPDLGDVASIGPDIAELIGAVGGGVGGAAIGGTSGSIVPLAGTATGAVGGAMAGAATGGTALKDLYERGVNWSFGNEDTRSAGDYAKDKAVDFALNAAGEGVGRGIAHGVGMGADYVGKKIAGKAADGAEEAAKRARDYADLGIEPTVGAINQNEKTLAREAALDAKPGTLVARTNEKIDNALADKFDSVVRGISPNGGTRESVGEALQADAKKAKDFINQRIGDQYQTLDDAAGGRNIIPTKTTELLDAMKLEKKGFSATEKLNKGTDLDQAIKQMDAIAKDSKKGMTFREMQDARTFLGRMAFQRDTSPYLKKQFQNAYEAVTKDMGDTAKAAGDDIHTLWRSADADYAAKFAEDGSNKILKPILNKSEPADAYTFLTGKVKQGGQRLADARKHIEASGGSDSWNQMVGQYMDEIGRSLDVTTSLREFNPKTYFTNWNKLSPEAKNVMFSGTEMARYRKDLDTISRVAANRFSNSTVRATTSNPVGRVIRFVTSGLGGHALGGPVGAIAGGIADTATEIVGGGLRNAYMDRLLTNPKFVNKIAKLPHTELQKGSLGKWIAELRNIGVGESANNAAGISNAIEQFIRDSGLEDEKNKQYK